MPTYTHQPDGTDGIDSMLASNAATTNYATRDIIDLYNDGAGDVRNSIWKNDFTKGTNPPPANAVVSAATLYLYNNQADAFSGNVVMNCYPVLRNWVENQATYNIFSTGNNWGTAGCENTTTDRESTSIGSTTWVDGEAVGTEHAITLNAAKVQAWISGAQANYGLLFKVTSGTNYFSPASSDSATAARRPKLVVEYTIGGSGMLMFF